MQMESGDVLAQKAGRGQKTTRQLLDNLTTQHGSKRGNNFGLLGIAGLIDINARKKEPTYACEYCMSGWWRGKNTF